MIKQRCQRQRINNWGLFILLSSCLLSCNNKDRLSYFGDMPESYICDSLARFQNLFENLSTKHELIEGNKSQLEIESNDCSLIPFCGYLTYFNDTIFYKKDKNDFDQPFLFFNISRGLNWVVEYSDIRSDKITYLGSVHDKYYKDSLHLFMLEPVKRMTAIDDGYLKYLLIGKGGIRYLTFSGSIGDFTVILNEHPRLIDPKKEIM